VHLVKTSIRRRLRFAGAASRIGSTLPYEKDGYAARSSIRDGSPLFFRRPVLFLAATIAWGLGIPAAAQAAGRYVEVEYPPSAARG